MATTRISDVILPSTFTPYVQQNSLTLSALYKSGIIAADQQLSAAAVNGGNLIHIPYWNDLEGESNVGSDNPDSHSTPDNIDADQDIAIKHFRNKSWSTMNLASELSGDDPAGVIGNSVSGFWARDMQSILIASLTGVFAANLADNGGDMIVDVANDASGAVEAGQLMGGDVILRGKQTMGDAANTLTAIAMHSVVHTNLQKQGLIQTIPNDQANIGWGTYMGYTVIVDDSCPAVQGTNRVTYTTYMLGRGAVAYGEGSPPNPTEVENKPSAGDGAGQEILYSRRTFVLHPRGIKFKSASMAKISPTNAELRLAANWGRVYQRKAIRLVAIKTNG